jgi:hypothetical protein
MLPSGMFPLPSFAVLRAKPETNSLALPSPLNDLANDA